MNVYRDKYMICFDETIKESELYKKRKKWIDDLLENKKFEQYLCAIERPYRLEEFIKNRHLVNEKKQAEILRWVWIDSESPSINKEVWKSLFCDYAPKDIMGADNWQHLLSLGEKAVVYRGCCNGFNDGLSWTLSKEVAGFFAKRFAGGKFKEIDYENSKGYEKACVVRREIELKNVLYFSDRDEQEIIML